MAGISEASSSAISMKVHRQRNSTSNLRITTSLRDVEQREVKLPPGEGTQAKK